MKTPLARAASIAIVVLIGGQMFSASSASSTDSKKSEDEITALLYDKHDAQAVINLANRALAHDPHNAVILLRRGNAYSTLRKRDLALADFTASIKAHPLADAYRERGYLYKVMGEPNRSLKDVEQAIKLSPTGRSMLLLADVYVDLGDLDRCISCASKALTMLKADRPDERDSVEMSSHVLLGKAYLGKEEPVKALPHFCRALDLIPYWTKASKANNKAMQLKIIAQVTDWVFLRGEAYEKLGKIKESIADYELVVAAQPKNFDYRKSLLRAYRKANDDQKALNLINQILSEDDAAAWYYKRSEIYKKMGKSDLAKKDFERARSGEERLLNSSKMRQ